MQKLPPGPRALPLIGHMPWFMADAPAFLAKLARDHGDVVSFKFGRQPWVLINHPDLIDDLVRDRTALRSDDTRRLLASFLGVGLLSLEGTTHLQHRRLIAPAFHRERIRHYGEVMSGETYETISRWSTASPIDLRAEMMQLTFRIVAGALFDGAKRDESRAVGEALHAILPWTMRSGALARMLPTSVPILYPPRPRRAIAKLTQLVTELVAERRRVGADSGDLMSMLIAARDEDGSSLSDADVAAEALTLLIAGHDTTANLLTWVWHLLTQHPAQQNALRAEVREALGDRAIHPEDLARLPLLDQVVRETLRLYPTAWAGDRVPQQDTTIGGYDIKAGTPVFFSMYLTQRDARFFPDPARFDPARFSPERIDSIPAGAYLPFGAGVHQCIVCLRQAPC